MEANPRSSLRKGFPIKIGGYAVGGGRNNAIENKCDINTVRFRQRRNSDTSFDRSSISRSHSKPPEVNCKQLYSPLLGLRRRSVGGVQFVNLGIGNEERDKAEFSVLEKCQKQKPSQKLSDPGPADNVTVQREKSAGKNVKNEEISEHHQSNDNVETGQHQELIIASADNNPIDNEEGHLQCVPNIPNTEEHANEDKSDPLEDVIAKMKNSLKAIKDGMNTKALIDINREFTPLDLPPLSPIPFRVETPADLPPLSSPVPHPQQIITQNLINVENQNPVVPPKRNTCVKPQNLQMPCFTQSPTENNVISDVMNEDSNEYVTLNLCLQTVSDKNRTTADQRSDFSGLTAPSDTSDVIRKLETECDNNISDCSGDDSSTEDESSVTSCSSSSSSSSSTLITVRNCDTLMDGCESDSSLYPDTDCEDIYGPRLSYSSSFTEAPGYLRSFEKLSCEKTIIVGHQPPESRCPRCLESDHWEDECWVLAEKVLCSMCSVPGHATVVHTTGEFAVRKLVVDTFGWLSFKHWFLEAEFREWWASQGYSGVPLSKILIRSSSHEVKLKIE